MVRAPLSAAPARAADSSTRTESLTFVQAPLPSFRLRQCAAHRLRRKLESVLTEQVAVCLLQHCLPPCWAGWAVTV